MSRMSFADDLSLEEKFEREHLHRAAADGNIAELKSLLKTDQLKRINTFDDVSLTPLMRAAMGGHVHAVKLLIKAGADVNAHDDRRVGNTAINEVAGDGSFEMIEVLLEAGANPNIRGWMHLNALDRARSRRRNPAIYAMLESAAKKFKA
jgi:ankyrin repeat protein